MHQVNCVSRGAKGLAATLFRVFPWANLYRRGTKRVPGAVYVDRGRGGRPGVIHVAGQVNPGKPRSGCGGGEEEEEDTAEQRLRWFEYALVAIGKLPAMAPGRDGHQPSLAVPWRIGCGLAGGDWRKYLTLLKRFTIVFPHVRVVVYKLPT